MSYPTHHCTACNGLNCYRPDDVCAQCVDNGVTRPVPPSPGSFHEWLEAINLAAKGEEWKP